MVTHQLVNVVDAHDLGLGNAAMSGDSKDTRLVLDA